MNEECNTVDKEECEEQVEMECSTIDKEACTTIREQVSDPSKLMMMMSIHDCLGLLPGK